HTMTAIMGASARRSSLELPYTHVDDLFIDGEWTPALGADRSPVTDPATGEVWGSVPAADDRDADAAVAAARRALPAWAALAPHERAAHLLRAAEEVERRAEVLSLTNTRENGTPVSESSGAAAN